MFHKILSLILLCFASSIFSYAVEDISSGNCENCVHSLLQKGDDQPFKVTIADVVSLVMDRVDKTAFEKIIMETLPSSEDIDFLYRQHNLDAQVVTELLRPSIFEAIEETLSAVDDDDQARTHENRYVETEITQKLGSMVREYVDNRNRMLTQKKEGSMQVIVQEMKSKMHPFMKEAIMNSIDDISNIEKKKYDKMIEKVLVPALAEAEKSERVLTVLNYPIVKDEMKILIKQNDTSYSSADELADGIFSKMVPFLREAIMMDLPKVLDDASLEGALNDIVEDYEGSLAKATKEGIMYAGKLQLLMKQESVDHAIRDKYVTRAKPSIKKAVDTVMARLLAKGFGAPGAVREYYLFKKIMAQLKVQGHAITSDIMRMYVNTEIQEKLGLSLEKPLPWLKVASDCSLAIDPKLVEVMRKEVADFRQNNPQLNECSASILAAMVVGAFKAKIKSAVDQYVQENGVPTMDKDQAIEEAITEQFNSLLVKTLEMDGMEYHDYKDGVFTDTSSEAFGDVMARIQSSVQTIIEKQLKMHRNQK